MNWQFVTAIADCSRSCVCKRPYAHGVAIGPQGAPRVVGCRVWMPPALWTVQLRSVTKVTAGLTCRLIPACRELLHLRWAAARLSIWSAPPLAMSIMWTTVDDDGSRRSVMLQSISLPHRWHGGWSLAMVLRWRSRRRWRSRGLASSALAFLSVGARATLPASRRNALTYV